MHSSSTCGEAGRLQGWGINASCRPADVGGFTEAATWGHGQSNGIRAWYLLLGAFEHQSSSLVAELASYGRRRDRRLGSPHSNHPFSRSFLFSCSCGQMSVSWSPLWTVEFRSFLLFTFVSTLANRRYLMYRFTEEVTTLTLKIRTGRATSHTQLVMTQLELSSPVFLLRTPEPRHSPAKWRG